MNPADQVEQRDISTLTPYPSNPRVHPEAVVLEIMESVRRFGVTVPIIIDEAGEIIAGHARAEAFKRLGLTNVPVVVARDWTDAQKRSYRILDNSIPLGSAWNPELLKFEIEDLQLQEYDLTLFNFDHELLLAMDGVTFREPDYVPPPKVPKTHTTIFVSVRKDRANDARGIIAKALKKAGIDHNL
jgi:hypothetical protein